MKGKEKWCTRTLEVYVFAAVAHERLIGCLCSCRHRPLRLAHLLESACSVNVRQRGGGSREYWMHTVSSVQTESRHPAIFCDEQLCENQSLTSFWWQNCNLIISDFMRGLAFENWKCVWTLTFCAPRAQNILPAVMIVRNFASCLRASGLRRPASRSVSVKWRAALRGQFRSDHLQQLLDPGNSKHGLCLGLVLARVTVHGHDCTAIPHLIRKTWQTKFVKWLQRDVFINFKILKLQTAWWHHCFSREY